ncbi:Protein RecA, partial [Pseudomonas syringae pv. berberidis]
MSTYTGVVAIKALIEFDYVRTSMDDNKKKALAAALGQIERQFGKGAVMRMGDHDRQAIPAISTGSLGLDIALGIGGLP